MAIIKIPDGNAFKLRVTAMVNDVPADLNVVNNIIVNFVRRGRIAQPYGLDSNGRLVIANDGSLARGLYGVELTGYHDGKPWRHYIKNAFKIVDENEDADTPTVVDDVPVYDLSDNMSFGGDGVTAAYVDAAIDAHNEDNEAHAVLQAKMAGKVDDVFVDGESVVETDPVTGKRTVGFHKDQFGKVDDVLVNGRSVVGEGGVARIDSQDFKGERGNGITSIEVEESQVDGGDNIIHIHCTDDEEVEGTQFRVKNGSRGNGIASVTEQTSSEDGGINTHTFTYTDGHTHVIHTRNGRTGAQGDSVLVGQGDLPLAHVLGQDNTKAMSQKGVTDAINNVDPIGDSEDPDADLEITDDFNNVLARFAEGHFETKNFSSEKALNSIERQEKNLGTENYTDFNASASYNVGDVVKYNGLLYKFINAHSGEWNSADVEMTNIAKELEKTVDASHSEAESDLDISDEEGNILARFAEGHFKTLNFDSRTASSSIKGKKISIIGDSISTFSGWIPTQGVNGYTYESYATYYPYSPLTNVTQTWWYKVISELSLTLGQNCSWSGSCTAGDGEAENTAHDGCSDRRIADLAINGTPDIIVIFMGTNDFSTTNGRNIPIGNLTSKDHFPTNGNKSTFSEGYGLMLSKVLQTYPLSHVFCCSLLDNCSPVRDQDGVYPTQNPHGVYLEDYNAKIKELALGYGAHFIDLHNCGIHWNNIPMLTVDGQTHPNEAGHTLIAQMVKKELIKYF